MAENIDVNYTYNLKVDESEALRKLQEFREKAENVLNGFNIGLSNLDNLGRENLTSVGSMHNRFLDFQRNLHNINSFNIANETTGIYRDLSMIRERNLATSIAAQTGGFFRLGGYNPATDLMTRDQYLYENMLNVKESTRDFLLGTAAPFAIGVGTGAAVGGLIGGLPGMLIGAGAGFAADSLSNAVLGGYKETSQFARAIQRIPTLGGAMGRDESMELSRNIRRMGGVQSLIFNRDLWNEGFSQDEVQDLFAFGAQNGMFNNTRSPQELEEKFKSYLKNTRDVMRVLQVSNEEAFKIIDNLKFVGVDSSSAAGYIRGLEETGKRYGLTPEQMLSAAQTGGRLAVATGGINTSSVFEAGQENQQLVMSIKEAIRQGMIESSVISRAGGVEQVATSMQELGVNLQKRNPLLAMAAQGIQGGVKNAEDYFDLQRTIRMGQAGAAQNAIDIQAANIAVPILQNLIGKGKPIKASTLEQTLITMFDFSPEQAQFTASRIARAEADSLLDDEGGFTSNSMISSAFTMTLMPEGVKQNLINSGKNETTLMGAGFFNKLLSNKDVMSKAKALWLKSIKSNYNLKSDKDAENKLNELFTTYKVPEELQDDILLAGRLSRVEDFGKLETALNVANPNNYGRILDLFEDGGLFNRKKLDINRVLGGLSDLSTNLETINTDSALEGFFRRNSEITIIDDIGEIKQKADGSTPEKPLWVRMAPDDNKSSTISTR